MRGVGREDGLGLLLDGARGGAGEVRPAQDDCREHKLDLEGLYAVDIIIFISHPNRKPSSLSALSSSFLHIYPHSILRSLVLRRGHAP